ncbi:F-box/WD repeat-containing protein 7-like [Stylophora pistillata]|uniref:Beta-TrCP n=1 Tax=Stylophora pistillata TaxID=50429 RepID=A0A2B4SHZ9_STYPI|nr:F-box/WD repeat-containing protein 7-like [Stylophora pistillata]PFX29501.1 Beta-TrCP [Stylophora pistillata]
MEKLSDEILVRIFSFLSARDICRCSKVCSGWYRLANDFHLWRKLFIESFDKFISDSSYYKNVFPTQWKELFIMRSNWLSGHCHVQSLHKKAITPEKTEPTKIVCLKISKCGGSVLASVNQDSKLVHLWSLIHKKSLHVVRCESVVGCVDFGNEGSQSLLAIGLYSNKFSIWDFHNGRIILSRKNITEVTRDQMESPRDTGLPPATAVCRVNLVDNKLATVTSQCVVKVWELDFNQPGRISCYCLHTLTTFKPRCSVLDIQLKNGENDVWSVSISHAAEVLENWNLIGFQTVRFQGHSLVEEDTGVNFKEESVDNEEAFLIAKFQTWMGPQKEQMGSRTSVSCLSISPCTKLVTSGQNDNTITLWDTATQSCRHTLFGHTGAVTCTDVDMHKVVSGSNDRTVKVWSLENGDCQLTLPGDHTSGVSSVTFNDHWVISGDSSGEIKVWDFAVNSLSVLQSLELPSQQSQAL